MVSSYQPDSDVEYIEIYSDESDSELSEAPEVLELTTNKFVHVPEATMTLSRVPTSILPAKKHAPKKPKNLIVINQDEVGRERAKYNQPDESKLIVVLKFGKPRPNKDGGFANVKEISYPYHRTVDWLDRKSIKSLNDWRDQLLRRNLCRRIRKTHHRWIERERDAIIKLARRQLQTRGMIAYNRLANNYNTEHANAKHRAGEAFTKKHNSTSDAKLVKDCDAPWRSSSAIERKSHEWDEWRTMMLETRQQRSEEAAQVDFREDSPDDIEIPDPKPDPPEYVPKSSKSRKGIKRQAEPSVTEALPAKRSLRLTIKNGEKVEIGMDGQILRQYEGDNAGLVVVPYGRSLASLDIGYKIQAILDGTNRAASVAKVSPAKRPNFSGPVSEKNAGLVVIRYGRAPASSALGHKIEAVLDGSKKAASLIAEVSPVKQGNANLGALEDHDEMTLEDVIAARRLMDLSENGSNNGLTVRIFTTYNSHAYDSHDDL